MLSATDLMRQAGHTAHDWMQEAAEFVERRFADYPPEARAALIASYVTTAAGDEIAMSLRGLAEAAEPLAGVIDGLREPLRSDHPLMGETLDGVRDALLEIAQSIGGRAAQR
ncbi:hypothetical protein MQE22_04145 [Acidithiobacillus sp. YTS05]|nr:hypothetical protein MQE22_04145 [Acidithiobacillus sp. YTS05]